MSVGKYLSLEEARKKGLLDRFAKEHPTKGNKSAFDNLLGNMAKTPKSSGRTSRLKRRGGG